MLNTDSQEWNPVCIPAPISSRKLRWTKNKSNWW